MLNVCKNNAILQYHITAMINKHWWEHFFPCQRLSSRLSYKTDARPHWHSPDSVNQHPTAGFLQCDHAPPICALAHYYLRAQSGFGAELWWKAVHQHHGHPVAVTIFIDPYIYDSKETDHWQSHETKRDEKFTRHQQLTLLSEDHMLKNVVR